MLAMRTLKLTLREIHINPIYRDLVLVITCGLLAGIALVTAAFMVFSQL